MLQFIIGPAASGKTTTVHNMIKNELNSDEKAILLVPEQNTFETEKAMLELFGGGFMSKVEVLSFTRMCEKAGQLYGGIAGFHIDDSQRNVLMARSLKKLLPHLKIFSKYISSTSFITQMVNVIKEFKMAGISSNMLISVCDKLKNNNLSEKILEISMIYSTYNDILKGVYIDPLDDLENFYQKAIDFSFFKDKTIYIDAFKGFTGLQLKILKLMILQAKKVVISFCCHTKGKQCDLGVFTNIYSNIEMLQNYANEHNIGVEKPILLNDFYFASKEIFALEKAITTNESIKYDNNDNVVILSLDTPVKEIEYVFKTIHRLVRAENYRFKDFVIIARDISKYERRIELASKKYNTPCFIDKRRSLMLSPIARFVLCLLKAAQNLNNEDILSLLKTELFQISTEELSQLEEYVYIWDINSDAWTEEWNMNPFGFSSVKEGEKDLIEQKLIELNKIRKKVILPILSLKKSFSGNVEEISKAVYDILIALKIDYKLRDVCNDYLMRGDSENADFIMQSWDSVMQLLDNMVRCYSDDDISAEEYINMLELSFAGCTIGSIPRTLDEVACGSADRIRPARPKVVFCIGMNLGEFPQTATDNGILLRNDRITLCENGIEISDRFKKYVIDENFLVYSSLCCATEKVYILRHNTNYDGSLTEESSIFTKLKGVFNLSTDLDDVLPETYEEGFALFAEKRNSSTELAATLDDIYKNNSNYKLRYDALNNLQTRVERRISGEICDRLFGNRLKLSSSKIEVYNKCPLSYFCSYILGIHKLQKAELDSLQRGTIVHFVLEKVIGEFGENFADAVPEDIEKAVDNAMDEYLSTVSGYEFLKSFDFKFAFAEMAKTLKILLKFMAEQFKNTDFVPVEYELTIDTKEGKIPSLVLKFMGDNTAVLNGQIDRVDVLRLENGKELVRIVDYKTSSKEFHLSDVLYGQNLQMLIYLYVLCCVDGSKFNKMEPAGILYMPSKRGTETTSKPNSLMMNGMVLDDFDVIKAMDKEGKGRFLFKKPTKERQNNPIISLDDFKIIFAFLEKKIKDTATNIRSGVFDLRPCDGRSDSACKYCDFKTVCAIEDDFEHNAVIPEYPTQILEKMKEAIEGEVD